MTRKDILKEVLSLEGNNWLLELPTGTGKSKIALEKVKSLGGKTPYEAFEFFYGKETLDKLHIQKIEKDKVTLQPYLLK